MASPMGGISSARILITGGSGQLARALALRLGASPAPGRIWMPPEEKLDIADPAKVLDAVSLQRPDWIINCAAYTAVDAAEGDPAGAYRINDAAVGILADAADEAGARILHVSTDYVFDGAKDGLYIEDDPTGPVNVYGASKLAGERRLLDHPVRSAILRTAWLYSDAGKNFLRWALESGKGALERGEDLPVVADQIGSPTDVHTLAVQMEAVVEGDLQGLFHAVAEGSASWLEFAREIFALAGGGPRLRAIRGDELKRPAPRASRIILENRRLKALGWHRMIPWEEGLRGVLARMKA